MEDDFSENSDSVSSYSSLEFNIRKEIENWKFYFRSPSTEVDLGSESSLSTMEELTRTALEMNSNLRMQLLLCERKLLLLKMGPLKIQTHTEKTIPNRDLTRGFLSKFMTPYFKDEKGHGCWADNTKTRLEFSILQCLNGPVIQANDYMKVALAIKNYLSQEMLRNRLNVKVGCADEGESLGFEMNKLRSAEAALEALQKETIWTLLGGVVDRELDWMKIVTQEPVHGLSATECQSIWNIVLKPQFKFKRWTKQRQRLLKELAVRNRFQCWEDIALEIGGGLTGFLAFTRFLTTCGHLLTTSGPWSKDEDSHLLSVINACTIGNGILWRKVLYYLEDRSVNQCISRWYKINPTMKRGRFSQNEDALLLHSIDKFGPDFVKIASVFGNRTVYQLRERGAALKTLMDEGKNTGKWSIEEDQLLLKLIEKHGESKWCLISTEMPSRNRVQIRQRYSVLKKKLTENPELDLSSLQRLERYPGTRLTKESAESLIRDVNITSFIKDRVADGKVTVRTPVRPGRKSRVLPR